MAETERTSFFSSEKHSRSALNQYESALHILRATGSPKTETYYPNNKPYLHFLDFVAEQGHKPILELTEYIPFLDKLLSQQGLDLVEEVPNTVDTQDEVWEWISQKIEPHTIGELEPFLPLLENQAFRKPWETWHLLLPKIDACSATELNVLTPVMKFIILKTREFQPKKYPFDRPTFSSAQSPEQAAFFDLVNNFFTRKVQAFELQEIGEFSEIIEYLIIFQDWNDETLSDILRDKLENTPFLELASYWKIISVLRFRNNEKLITDWEWFVQKSESFTLPELTPWITYLFNLEGRKDVYEWFIAKAEHADSEQLLPWAKIVQFFETSSTTQGLGIKFFMDKLSQLPLDKLEDWKILFENFWKHDEATIVYAWLKSRIFQDSGVHLSLLSDWQDTFAELTWKAEPQLLEQMVNDISEYTETAEEWFALKKWVEALTFNLNKIQNKDGTRNTPEHESPGRKAFLFLWENFKKTFDHNPEIHAIGSLITAFQNNQGHYRYSIPLSEHRKVPDFENFGYWIQQQLTPETRLNEVGSWQFLLARNDFFFQQEIKNMFAQSTLHEVNTWRDFVQASVETLMGGEAFDGLSSKIDLLVRFGEEVSKEFTEVGYETFSELYITFRDFVMNLSDTEALMLRNMVRMKGVLNHMIMNLIDGQPFALELAKTGGRLFIWSEGNDTHITNMMTETAYQAWQKAHDLRIPVTPIHEVREVDDMVNIPEIFRGTTLVDTRAVGLAVHQLNDKTKLKLRPEIDKQMKKIRKKLKESEINYTNPQRTGHDREHNYLIELIDKKYFKNHGGWKAVNTMPYSKEAFSTDFSVFDDVDTYDRKTSPWVIVIRLIDWDLAYLQEDEQNIDHRFEPNHDGSQFVTILA